MEQSVLRKIIAQLRKEHAEIESVIRALEALATGKRRRGRPPKVLAGRQTAAAKGKPRKPI